VPRGGNLIGNRRLTVGHQGLDFSAQHLFVQSERLFAVAIEVEVGMGLHRKLLQLSVRLQFARHRRALLLGRDLLPNPLFLFPQLRGEFGAEIFCLEDLTDLDLALPERGPLQPLDGLFL